MKSNRHICIISFNEIDGVSANFEFLSIINGKLSDEKFTNAIVSSLLKSEIMEYDFIDDCPELHLYDKIEDYFAQLTEILKDLDYMNTARIVDVKEKLKEAKDALESVESQLFNINDD